MNKRSRKAVKDAKAMGLERIARLIGASSSAEVAETMRRFHEYISAAGHERADRWFTVLDVWNDFRAA